MSVTRIIMRNGQSVPTSGDLEVAELAVNTLDGSVYVKDENNQVVPVGTDYDDSQIIADLEFEVDQRKAADAKIEGDLQALDISLNAGLTAEVLARTNADSNLQDQLDELEGKVLDADGNPIGGGGDVESVNGKTGEVVLDAEDVGAMATGDAYTKADSDAKYELKGDGGGAGIDPGTSAGQMLRWDGADWRHTSKVMLDTHGMMTVDSGKIVGDECGLHFDSVSEAILPIGGDGKKSTFVDFGDASNKFRAAYFSGRVDCGSLYVNGNEITGGSGTGGAVDSVNGETGEVVLTPEMIGAEPKIATKNTAFNKSFGTTSGTVAQGNASYSKNDSDVKYAQKTTTYTKTEADNKFASKTDVYTKAQSDSFYENKGTAYTKSQSDGRYELKGAGGGGDPFPWTGATASFTTNSSGSVISINSTNARGPEVEFNNGGTKLHMRSTAGSFELVNSGYSAVFFSVSTAGVASAADFVASSDERLKEDIKPVKTGVITKLDGVDFSWKEDGRRSSGFIAQDIQKVPELAHLVHDEGDHLAVNYQGMIPYLLAEIKSLRAEVDMLKHEAK